MAINRVRDVIFLTGILCSLEVLSQEGYSRQHTWFDYNPAYYATPQFSIYGDIGARRVFRLKWNRFLWRAGMNYQPFKGQTTSSGFLQQAQLHAGLGNFFTHYSTEINQFEFRLYQGLKVFWPTLARMRLQHYFRAEERFEKLVTDREYSNATLRLRYMLGTRIRFQKPCLADFYFPLSIEFYFNPGKDSYYNDLIRATSSIGYYFTEKFRAELNLTYFSGRYIQYAPYANHDLVFRLRIFHRLH